MIRATGAGKPAPGRCSRCGRGWKGNHRVDLCPRCRRPGQGGRPPGAVARSTVERLRGLRILSVWRRPPRELRASAENVWLVMRAVA